MTFALAYMKTFGIKLTFTLQIYTFSEKSVPNKKIILILQSEKENCV